MRDRVAALENIF